MKQTIGQIVISGTTNSIRFIHTQKHPLRKRQKECVREGASTGTVRGK